MDRRALWAGLVAAVAIACGDAASEMAGNAFIETGGSITDAGDALRDSGMDMLADAAEGMGNALEDAGAMLSDGGEPGDASAQGAATTLEAECELESGTEGRAANGDSRIELTYYAEVDVSAFAAQDLVGAAFVLCELDEESDVDAPPPPCGDDLETECIGEYPLPLPDCVIEPRIEIHEGKARVACGTHYEREGSATLESFGHRYESVKLVIP